ncbi:GAP family protein [Streptomyces goshikiensis]|uniref:GAP family protein n=1 Tax=Streptomyces goshikiensis TaxID=1942 RepID=UPI0036C613CA
MIARVVLLTGGQSPARHSTPSTTVAVAKLAIGVGLVLYGAHRRRRPPHPHGPPHWTARVDGASLATAAGLAWLLQPWVLVGAGATTVVAADLSFSHRHSSYFRRFTSSTRACARAPASRRPRSRRAEAPRPTCRSRWRSCVPPSSTAVPLGTPSATPRRQRPLRQYLPTRSCRPRPATSSWSPRRTYARASAPREPGDGRPQGFVDGARSARADPASVCCSCAPRARTPSRAFRILSPTLGRVRFIDRS